MDQMILTQNYIQTTVSSYEAYKQQSGLIKRGVQENQKESFQIIFETISMIVDDEASIPLQLLMTLRLCKDLMDIKNPDFAELFKETILLRLRVFAEYEMESQDNDRGRSFFSKRTDLESIDLRSKILIGNSIVRLTLDCIQAWASYFPSDFKIKDSPSIFLKFYIGKVINYLELIKKGVSFAPLVYFNELDSNIYNAQAYNGMLEKLEDSDPELQQLLTQKREQHKSQEQIKTENVQNQMKQDMTKQKSDHKTQEQTITKDAFNKMKEDMQKQSSDYLKLKEINQELKMENKSLKDLVNFQRLEIMRLTKLTEQSQFFYDTQK